MAPEGVSIHATRVPLGVMRAGDSWIPPLPWSRCAPSPTRRWSTTRRSPRRRTLRAIGFAFTSFSHVRGAADDEVLRQRLETRTHGIPVAICSVSAVLGLRALGARRSPSSIRPGSHRS